MALIPQQLPTTCSTGPPPQPLTEDPVLLLSSPLPPGFQRPRSHAICPRRPSALGALCAQQVSRAQGRGECQYNHRLCLSGDIWLRLRLRLAPPDTSGFDRETHPLERAAVRRALHGDAQSKGTPGVHRAWPWLQPPLSGRWLHARGHAKLSALRVPAATS